MAERSKEQVVRIGPKKKKKAGEVEINVEVLSGV